MAYTVGTPLSAAQDIPSKSIMVSRWSSAHAACRCMPTHSCSCGRPALWRPSFRLPRPHSALARSRAARQGPSWCGCKM
eukprot:15439112-Alexandrium_andersonii.AAC.1